MSKIQQFERSTDFNALRLEIDSALASLGQKYGVNFHAGNVSYNSQCATFKLEITTLGDGGTVETKEAKDFKLYASSYGFKPEDLGRVFKFQGSDYKITGLKPRSRNCICIMGVNNNRAYKINPDAVLRSL